LMISFRPIRFAVDRMREFVQRKGNLEVGEGLLEKL
jgi:hypothetical protein